MKSTALETAARERVKRILGDGFNVSVNKNRFKDLPEWFDEALFTRGQKYFYNNYYAMLVSKLIGLVLVLSIPTILDVIVLTKKSSEPFTAFRRYLDTIRHMIRWYKYDVKNFESKSQKSARIINNFHCAAVQTSNKAGLGLRVSQRDMSLSQFGFIGLLLLKKKELGVKGTEEDEKGLVHFWRTIGYMLGIQDEFNMCEGSLVEVRCVCELLLNDFFVPLLRNPVADFDHMVKVMMEGLQPVTPLLNVDAFMTYTYQICGVDGMANRITTWYQRWSYNILTFTHEVLLGKDWLSIVFRPVLNYNLMFSVWINTVFPFGAAFKFGSKAFARVELDHKST